MSSSKELPPSTTPFFPNQFIKNQFCSKAKYIPDDTDLSGQVAIVTGSNTGLGLECARQLLSYKLSKLIVAVRSLQKGEDATAGLRKTYPDATIEVWPLDMLSYKSIQEFTSRVEKDLPRLDIAILNAGMTNSTFKIAGTGHEETMQVNYLSTMFLSILLLPLLKKKSPAGSPGRLTIVTTMLSLIAKFEQRKEDPLLKAFDDEEFFDHVDIYPTSKLLGQIFLWKLTDLVSADDVVINLVEPGFIKGTDLQRDIPLVAKLGLNLLKALSGRTVQEGASTYLDATITKGKESHGCILMNWEIIPYPALAYSEEGKAIKEKLWQETLEKFKFIDVNGILESFFIIEWTNGSLLSAQYPKIFPIETVGQMSDNKRDKGATGSAPPPPPPPPGDLRTKVSPFVKKLKTAPPSYFFQPEKPLPHKDSFAAPTGPYFFYGTLSDPAMLRDILGLEIEPQLRPATIIGYECKLWGQYPALLDAPEKVVHGAVYNLETEEHGEDLLAMKQTITRPNRVALSMSMGMNLWMNLVMFLNLSVMSET